MEDRSPDRWRLLYFFGGFGLPSFIPQRARAKILNLEPSTLRSRMKKLGIKRGPA